MKITSMLNAFGLAVVFLAGPVSAQNVKWDMANEYQETSIHGQAQKVFTDTAKSASGGSIETVSYTHLRAHET